MIIVILLTQILAAFHSFNHKKEENSQLLNSEITKKQSFKNKKECNVCEVYFDFQPSDFLSTENLSFVSNTSTSIKTYVHTSLHTAVIHNRSSRAPPVCSFSTNS